MRQPLGEFVLEALLAQGGFGQVYRAHHATTGRVVAVKVLHGELCSAPAAVARFLEQERQEMAEQLTELRDLLPYRAPDGGIG